MNDHADIAVATLRQLRSSSPDLSAESWAWVVLDKLVALPDADLAAVVRALVREVARPANPGPCGIEDGAE